MKLFLNMLLNLQDEDRVLVMIDNNITNLSRYYYIADGIIYTKTENNMSEKIYNIGEIRYLAEKECENDNSWGDLYTAPMEHLGSCEIKICEDLENYEEFKEYNILNMTLTNEGIILIKLEKIK